MLHLALSADLHNCHTGQHDTVQHMQAAAMYLTVVFCRKVSIQRSCEGCCIFIRIVYIHLPDYTMSHPTNRPHHDTQLSKPEIKMRIRVFTCCAVTLCYTSQHVYLTTLSAPRLHSLDGRLAWSWLSSNGGQTVGTAKLKCLQINPSLLWRNIRTS